MAVTPTPSFTSLYGSTFMPSPSPTADTSASSLSQPSTDSSISFRRTSSIKTIQENLQQNRNWTQEFSAIFQDYFRLRGTIPRLFKEFEDTAMAIGKTIISERNLPPEKKTIPPLGQKGDLGVAGGEKYIVGSVFFKYAVDLFGIYGGDHFAQKAAGLELKHLNTLFSLRTSGKISFSFPLLCLIDYRGFRLVACSILPIDEETIVYGSSDQGLTVHADSQQMNEMMREVGKLLNLKEHVVTGRDGVAKVLCGPIDVEGHIGRDGAFYLIDYQRLMPSETPSGAKGSHLYCLLRPELVGSFPKPLSSDAFSSWGAHHAALHNAEVIEATNYLREKVVSDLVRFLSQQQLSISTSGTLRIIEGATLTAELHKRGINLRYLGMISELIPERNIGVRSAILVEQVARLMKAELKNRMRQVLSPEEGAFLLVAAHYFNLVFGSSLNSQNYWRTTLVQQLQQRFVYTNPSLFLSSHVSLRSQIKLPKLFLRAQELLHIYFHMDAVKLIEEGSDSPESPFSSSHITAMGVKVKRMNAWLDPRAFQTEHILHDADENIAIASEEITGSTLVVEGVTGNIYRGLWKGRTVAVTRFHDDKEFRQFRDVASELGALNHPNLVRIHGLVRSPGCCVAEFVSGGQLASYLEDDSKQLDWTLRYKLARQISAGMNYLHSQCPPFMHRNLTSANVLLTPANDVKINTVRLTRHVGFSCDTSVLGIFPPEILDNREWSEKSDVYCFGLIMYELLTRSLPDLSDDVIPSIPDDIVTPPDFAQLMFRCLHRTPAQRPTFDEILELLCDLVGTPPSV